VIKTLVVSCSSEHHYLCIDAKIITVDDNLLAATLAGLWLALKLATVANLV
jgi:hypothetical protein